MWFLSKAYMSLSQDIYKKEKRGKLSEKLDFFTYLGAIFSCTWAVNANSMDGHENPNSDFWSWIFSIHSSSRSGKINLVKKQKLSIFQFRCTVEKKQFHVKTICWGYHCTVGKQCTLCDFCFFAWKMLGLVSFLPAKYRHLNGF